MTSAEIDALLEVLYRKRLDRKMVEEDEARKLFAENIKLRLLAGEPVPIYDISEALHAEFPVSFPNWLNGRDKCNRRISTAFGMAGHNEPEFHRMYFQSVKNERARLAKQRKERRKLAKQDRERRRKIELQKPLNELAKRFDITKMIELPEIINDYCLEFLSTPEKRHTPDSLAMDYHNPGQRPAHKWEIVKNYCWTHTWQTKYIPLLVENFTAKSFNRIKALIPVIANSLVTPKFSKSSKKLFLEQLQSWQPVLPTDEHHAHGLRLCLVKFILGSRLA